MFSSSSGSAPQAAMQPEASTPPIPNSPFFHPSNRRLKTLKTPKGSKRPVVVVKTQVGGEAKAIPLDQTEKKSSLLGAYANLCNVTIGGGIVGLPYAIKEAGLFAGTFMIVLIALLTDYSLRQLINTGKKASVNSYETLMEASFGRAGFIFVSVSMFLMSYGAMMAYLIIIKDVLPVLFHVPTQDEHMRRMIMFVSSALIILPLSMQKDMADLEKTSRVNVFLNICLVLLIVGSAPIAESVEAQGGLVELMSKEDLFNLNTFFVGFGVCSFAFVCQDSSFIIAGSLTKPTKYRWKKVTNGAMMTCCALELVLGVSGYLAFSSHTMGNILNNMPSHHWPGFLSRGILATTMFFAFPLNAFIARHACVVLLFDGVSAHEGDDSIVLMRRDRRIILTCVLYFAALVPAILVENTGKVLAVTGAIAGSSLAYIGPGMTFIAVYYDVFIELVRKRWKFHSSLLLGYPSTEKDESDDPPGNYYDDSNEALSARSEVSTLEIISWYALGMPLWVFIALSGKENLSEHFLQEEMTSPGIVLPRRVNVQLPTIPQEATPNFGVTDAKSDVKRGMFRSPSDSGLATGETKPLMLQKPTTSPCESPTYAAGPLSMTTSYGTSQVIAGNKGISKAIASLNSQDDKATLNRMSSFTALEVEIELKKSDPKWLDFGIAIGYVILGFVAMIFGLVSSIV